ncbi:MAG: NADH-quinone oxidoreductase subunit H [Eubacteriales bacterium]|nr:NADH-quinone oxidoreductase subunit H [Eubacteriales bacterium]
MTVILMLVKIFLFPGLLFTLLVSLWLAGIDRRLVARMQRRVGPPLLQPWYDYLKCCGKETIIPRKANKRVFLAAPLLGLASVLVTAMLLPVGGISVFSGLTGAADLVVILYLLTFASVTLIVGAAASGSPFAGVGLSREMVAMISYELPFVLVILAVGRAAGQGLNEISQILLGAEGMGVTFSLADIAAYQQLTGLPLIARLSLIPAAIAMLFVIPCEVGQQPLDIDEAETEICEGVLAEYSGRPLARFKLMHLIKMYVMSGLFVAMFLHIETGILVLNVLIYLVLCTLVTFVSMTVPHAIMARLKVEQVFKFYWTFVTALALISLILVWCGV